MATGPNSAHKPSPCFTSWVGFPLRTVKHAVPSLSLGPWRGLMSGSEPRSEVSLADADMLMSQTSFFLPREPLGWNICRTFSYRSFMWREERF